MGAKKSLTDELDPEEKQQQEAQKKLAQAEALVAQQAGITNILNIYIEYMGINIVPSL